LRTIHLASNIRWLIFQTTENIFGRSNILATIIT